MRKVGQNFQRKKINATYKNEQKLFKQQEQIYLNLTKIQETDVEGYSSYCDHHPWRWN